MRHLLPFALLALASPSFAHAQAAVPAEMPANDLTLWQLLVSAGWVLLPLGLLSVLVAAVIVFNFIWLRPRNVATEDFLENARALLRGRKIEDLKELCEEHKELTPAVLHRVITFAKDNPDVHLESLKEIAEVEGARVAARLARANSLLMDLGVMAPLVGLLGTVVGILRSFGNIASDATPMRTMLLAGGVSQALVATAMGLGIGLTAMLFYSYFRGRVTVLIGYFESVLTELLVKTYEGLSRSR